MKRKKNKKKWNNEILNEGIIEVSLGIKKERMKERKKERYNVLNEEEGIQNTCKKNKINEDGK